MRICSLQERICAANVQLIPQRLVNPFCGCRLSDLQHILICQSRIDEMIQSWNDETFQSRSDKQIQRPSDRVI